MRVQINDQQLEQLESKRGYYVQLTETGVVLKHLHWFSQLLRNWFGFFEETHLSTVSEKLAVRIRQQNYEVDARLLDFLRRQWNHAEANPLANVQPIAPAAARAEVAPPPAEPLELPAEPEEQEEPKVEAPLFARRIEQPPVQPPQVPARAPARAPAQPVAGNDGWEEIPAHLLQRPETPATPGLPASEVFDTLTFERKNANNPAVVHNIKPESVTIGGVAVTFEGGDILKMATDAFVHPMNHLHRWNNGADLSKQLHKEAGDRVLQACRQFAHVDELIRVTHPGNLAARGIQTIYHITAFGKGQGETEIRERITALINQAKLNNCKTITIPYLNLVGTNDYALSVILDQIKDDFEIGNGGIEEIKFVFPDDNEDQCMEFIMALGLLREYTAENP